MLLPIDLFIILGATYPLDLVRSRLSIATATIALRPNTSQPAPIPATTSSSSANIPRPALASAYHTSVSLSPSPSAATLVLNASKEAESAAQRAGRDQLTMMGMARKVMHEEGGVRALYKGLPATAFGVAPYVGINFAAYEVRSFISVIMYLVFSRYLIF